jgi:hypothetical protein
MYEDSRLYLGKQFIDFKLVELCYLMKMLHFVMISRLSIFLLKMMLLRMSLLRWNQHNLLTLLLSLVTTFYTISYLMSSILLVYCFSII